MSKMRFMPKSRARLIIVLGGLSGLIFFSPWTQLPFGDSQKEKADKVLDADLFGVLELSEKQGSESEVYLKNSREFLFSPVLDLQTHLLERDTIYVGAAEGLKIKISQRLGGGELLLDPNTILSLDRALSARGKQALPIIILKNGKMSYRKRPGKAADSTGPFFQMASPGQIITIDASVTDVALVSDVAVSSEQKAHLITRDALAPQDSPKISSKKESRDIALPSPIASGAAGATSRSLAMGQSRESFEGVKEQSPLDSLTLRRQATFFFMVLLALIALEFYERRKSKK